MTTPIDRESVERLAGILRLDAEDLEGLIGIGYHSRIVSASATLLAFRAALDEAEAENKRLRERCAISETPTPSQVNDACLSYDHSFGLMDAKQADALRFQAKEWWRCIARAALKENPDANRF